MRTRFPFRQATGLYVHSSPPTGVPVHDSVVRQWLRGGEISRLKELLLEGEGASLIGEYSPDVTARNFLRALPRILNRIEEAHEAAASGDVDRVAQAIKRERSVRVELSKDHSGLSLLHKAVIHGHRDLQIWLVENYPDLVHLLDREKRSPLHYAGSSPDGESVWKLLTTFGADSNVVDAAGYTPAYYMLHPRRARPPQPKGGLSGIKQEKGLVVKPANIRIWIHDRDLGRLQKVVWEGYGQRLLKETSTQPKVRRFLQAVPYILGSIRDVHKAAIENDIETLKRRSEDPIPVDILLSKDVNGLNPLHKAAGIGQKEAVEEILKRAPEAANAQDSFGRTPLHYAAGLRNPEMYQALVEAGATDHLPDKKGNTPSHYRSKPSELEGAKLLSVIPEAPRTAHIFPPSWDWKLLHSGGPQLKSQMSTETITLDSTADDITDTANETEEISRDEVVEESRPEVSEDEGMGSENAQSVEDSTSPQNGENIDMEDDPGEKFGQTITLSNPVFLSGIRVGPDEDEAKQAEEENEPETSNNAQSDEISQSQDDDQPEENTTDKGTRRTEAERVVAAGDMEAMAEMVLAGEGEALLDLTSDNPDVQLFINNVPQYMAKIERVHKSSREGDLRGVRTSLDRRKYAVAKDNSTSLKPTPLHVAVLFGRTSVLRYLAGRFPETMHAQDSAGRTPLHYAATLPDNGHFYSLLITLGADKAILDKSGKTAEYYLKNKEDLTREMLLAEYQDRPVPIDTSGLNFNRYSDKVEDDTISARHDVDEEALLDQMERCFKLLTMRAPGSILGRILSRDLFEELRLYYTKLDNTLLDIIRPMGKDLALGKNRILTDPNFSGIMIPDQQSFILFRKLLEPLIKEVNGVTEFNNGFGDYFAAEDQNFFTLDLDPGGVIVKSCVVEVVRNLAPVPFVKNLKLSELEKVEVALSTVLTGYYRKNKEAAFIDDAGENHGSYYSLGEILENKEVFQDLKEEGLVVNGIEEGDWPYGRGVFISPYGDVTAWINIREHMQLLSVTPADKRGLIGPAYKTAYEIVQSLEEKVECLKDLRMGRLATDPGFVGNCLRIHVVASLPHIGEDLPSLRKLCGSRNLLVEENSRPGIFKLRNRSCQNMKEIDLLKSYVSAITDIIEMEKASMRVTVAQIPNLIKNFLRKKSSKENLK
ncbi:uncharacterized protein [Halyomorpha halys]|uniref:uncharacterized protein isoform X4 n=1 Tax=Halyomorpha halys TaxID=286706 RepID=UPI0034D205A9